MDRNEAGGENDRSHPLRLTSHPIVWAGPNTTIQRQDDNPPILPYRMEERQAVVALPHAGNSVPDRGIEYGGRPMRWSFQVT